MAQGFKSGGKDIKKGQVLNPKGRAPLDATMTKAKKLNKALLDRYLNMYINSSVAELTELVKVGKRAAEGKPHKGDKDISSMEMMIVKVILEGVKRGDPKYVNFILERTVGKVKDEVVLESTFTTPQGLSNLSDKELKTVTKILEKCKE